MTSEDSQQTPENEEAEWDGPPEEHPGGYFLEDIFCRSINEPGIHCDFVRAEDQADANDC
jgi:hypothetical protein